IHVQNQYVPSFSGYVLEHLFGVFRLSELVEPEPVGKYLFYTLPHDRVVVGNKDFQHCVLTSQGIWTLILVPIPGTPFILRSPLSSCTLSLIPKSPIASTPNIELSAIPLPSSSTPS